MSQVAGQRALDQIEKTLAAGDYRLASLPAFFTRLARDDAMPGTERVQAKAAGSGQGHPGVKDSPSPARTGPLGTYFIPERGKRRWTDSCCQKRSSS
jgi:hypothetical protein